MTTELEAAFVAADAAYYGAGRTADAARSAMEAEVRQAMEAAAAPIREAHKPSIEAALEEKAKAGLARKEAKVAMNAARLAELGDLRRIEWERPGRPYERRPMRKTGRTGQYEIYMLGCGATAGSGSVQEGDIILRINTKDGKAGARYEWMGSGTKDPWNWHPVDWEPSKDKD